MQNTKAQTAHDAFASEHAAIQRKLATLQKGADDFFGESFDGINWAAVGTMAAINAALDDAINKAKMK